MGGCDLDLVRDGATVAVIKAEGDAVDAACQVDLTDEVTVRAWAAEVDGIRGDIQVLNANAASTRFAALDAISRSYLGQDVSAVQGLFGLCVVRKLDGMPNPKTSSAITNRVGGAVELVGAPTLRDTLRATAVHGAVCFMGMLSDEWTVPDFYPIDYIPSGVRLTAYTGEAEDLPPAVP